MRWRSQEPGTHGGGVLGSLHADADGRSPERFRAADDAIGLPGAVDGDVVGLDRRQRRQGAEVPGGGVVVAQRTRSLEIFDHDRLVDRERDRTIADDGVITFARTGADPISTPDPTYPTTSPAKRSQGNQTSTPLFARSNAAFIFASVSPQPTTRETPSRLAGATSAEIPCVSTIKARSPAMSVVGYWILSSSTS
jgi:hypothetical protein